jgi:SNF2 family DNA or RNA helicase
MSETYLFDKLVSLNDVYNNTLYEAKEVTQPASIKTTLLPHQIALVEGMNKYRNKMTRGFVHNSQAVNGKIGILGDPAGTGKTLSVLSYIAKYSDVFPKISCELTSNSSRYFY